VWIEIAIPVVQAGIIASPSTRRVWIEISIHISVITPLAGHPPPGGCGLKFLLLWHVRRLFLSPSTRRVWIEINLVSDTDYAALVTLHPEGVD